MEFIDPKIYYKNLPQKRMAVGALFFNEQGQILILRASYKKYWTLPGGVVEKDESLDMALRREVKEELDIDFVSAKLAVLDYCFPKVVNNVQNTESLQILFDCGVITKKIVALIKIDGEEILEFRFCSLEESLELLGLPLKKRIKSYLDGKNVVYLENGYKI